jgi:hypothetical protein
MVDHVQPVLDRVGAVSERPLPSRSDGVARARAWIARETLLIPVVALFVIGVVGNLPSQLLQDGWLTILGGHEIVRHGLPSHDSLTIWTHGRHWVDQQWLAQLFFYGLFALGGIKLALFGHAAAVAGAFTLAVVVARRRGASTRSVCWIAVPVYFLLTWTAWNARAQSLAILFFVVTVVFLLQDAHSPSRRVFLVLPLLVLWANIHGTAITGAALVILWAVTYAAQNRARPFRTWLPRSGVLVLAPLACLFASPYATSLPGYYETILSNSGFRQFIVEWRPTAPSIQTAPFYLLAFLAVWLIGRQKERFLRFEQVLLGFTLLMGLQSMRSVLWFALTALMLIPAALDGVLKPNTKAMRFQLLNRALVVASVAGVIATVAWVGARPTSWFERDYPTGVLTAFDRVQARDPGMRVFADEMYGDWLLLQRPELRGRLAYDIRFELGSRNELRRLIDVKQRVEGWRRVLAPYSLFVLRSDSESKLAAALLRQPGARREYRGHGAVVISRRARWK